MIDYETGIQGFADKLKTYSALEIYNKCYNDTKAFYDKV
jgi:hypothetical protein